MTTELKAFLISFEDTNYMSCGNVEDNNDVKCTFQAGNVVDQQHSSVQLSVVNKEQASTKCIDNSHNQQQSSQSSKSPDKPILTEATKDLSQKSNTSEQLNSSNMSNTLSN